jgi:hypothetical protein
MLTKVVLVFLGLMVIIGMIGKALFPATMNRVVRKSLPVGRCATCGRYLLGAKGCDGRGPGCKQKG